MKKLLVTFAILAASTTSAFAHHPLGGMPMTNFTDGLLSGIGHPLLGFDHLFFVVAIGIAAMFTGRALAAPAGYIAAMIAGTLLMGFGIGLPMKETLVGLSLLVVGSVILSGRGLGLGAALMLFAGFGLFHGSAFGDSLAAQETAVGGSVLIGYLIGLAMVQYAIAIAAGWAMKTIWNVSSAKAIEPRLAGAVVAGVGLFLTLENVEGAAFAAMGWAA